MANKINSVYDIYLLNGTANNITIETFIGDIGQTSLTDVTLTDPAGNNVVLFNNYNGNIPITVIGNNIGLKGYRLIISCNITVTSATSNYCDEIVTLKGGTNDETYMLYDNTLNSGQYTDLLCILKFF